MVILENGNISPVSLYEMKKEGDKTKKVFNVATSTTIPQPTASPGILLFIRAESVKILTSPFDETTKRWNDETTEQNFQPSRLSFPTNSDH